MQRTSRLTPPAGALAIVAASVLAGCSSDPAPGSPAYQEGRLGNGGFVFNCDDSVDCTPSSTAARTFPEAVALGSTFGVRFLPRSSNDIDIGVNDDPTPNGITVQPVGRGFLSAEGTDGLVAKQAGQGTLVARDAAGTVYDFTTLRIAQPDALAIYGTTGSGISSSRVTAISLSVGRSASYRARALEKGVALAGTFPSEWVSSDTTVADVVMDSTRSATLTAKKAGNVTLKVSGAAFSAEIPVEVTP